MCRYMLVAGDYNGFVDSNQNGPWHVSGNAPKKRFIFDLDI